MTDTIVALATPPGFSGLAIVRLSGPEAVCIIDEMFSGRIKIANAKSHTIHYGRIEDEGKIVDDVTVSVFLEPNSYTGENVVEIGCHGGMFVYREIIDFAIKKGARNAEPGEFTKRAFINGRMDLSQVEAVSDLIHSLSVKSACTSARQLDGEFTKRIKEVRASLLNIASLLELEMDFSDEDIDLISKKDIEKKITEASVLCRQLSESYNAAKILRSGYFVGIIGYPNSGKSTLFNALLKRNRAIVSEMPGTTRDYLEEFIYINGIPVKIIDTAGIRETNDFVELEGIRIVNSLVKQCNLLFLINDITLGVEQSDILKNELIEKYPEQEIIIIQNKTDKIKKKKFKDDEIYISAKFGDGLNELKNIIAQKTEKSFDAINDILVNERQSILFDSAANSLDKALNSVLKKLDNEIIALEIKEAANCISEITGEKWSEEVLNNIFKGFCIGK